jgi:hypothetical protein
MHRRWRAFIRTFLTPCRHLSPNRVWRQLSHHRSQEGACGTSLQIDTDEHLHQRPCRGLSRIRTSRSIGSWPTAGMTNYVTPLAVSRQRLCGTLPTNAPGVGYPGSHRNRSRGAASSVGGLRTPSNSVCSAAPPIYIYIYTYATT